MILLYSIIVRSFCKWYLVYAVRSKPFWQTKNPLSTRMNEMNELETPKKSGLFNSKIYLRDKNIETSEFRLGGVERATKVLFFGSLGVRFFFEFRDWSRRLEVRHCGCGRKKLSDAFFYSESESALLIFYFDGVLFTQIGKYHESYMDQLWIQFWSLYCIIYRFISHFPTWLCYGTKK